MTEEYPRTLLELERQFGDETACRAYLFSLRWPGGFACPHCRGQTAWAMTGGRWLCASCRKQVSVAAGTIFQDSKLPLMAWFRAMWQLTSQKNGVSAMGLQRVLGLGSYKTAWTMMHKLRRAMVRPGRDRLHGVVEVGEAYWGGEEENVRGRQTYEKTLIAIAAEADGNGIGRIRLRLIRDTSRATLHGFIAEAIEPGSTVQTDGLQAYRELHGHAHERRVQATSPRMRLIYCRELIASSLCSSVGCWRRIKAQLLRITSKIISTGSLSDSTAATRPRGANCSIVWLNRPCKLLPRPTKRWAITSCSG